MGRRVSRLDPSPKSDLRRMDQAARSWGQGFRPLSARGKVILSNASQSLSIATRTANAMWLKAEYEIYSWLLRFDYFWRALSLDGCEYDVKRARRRRISGVG